MAKTKGVKNCTPGNVKCGQRCIPQSWDCRLRGEGQDKALKASRGLDPLATAAQVERGIKRIGKGIKKGSFSEIEGGRTQLVRAVSRNARGKEGKPLTLKEKKEIQDRLIKGTAILGTALGVLAAGYGTHRTLMRAPSYRSRVGNRINNAANDAQNALLDSIPLTGGRRVANSRAASEAGNRGLRITTPSQASNRAVVIGSVGQPPSGPTAELNKRFNALKFSSTATPAQIEARSLRTYLTSRVNGKNIHAESSAMQTLASAYGVKLKNEGPLTDVKQDLLVSVGRAIDAEKAAIRSDMRQRGFAVTSPEQQSLYIEAVFGGDTIRESRVRQILNSTNGEAVAKKTLSELTRDWGEFYESIAASIGADIKRLSGNRALSADKNDIVQSLRVKHAEYLDRNMTTKAGGRINRFAGASEQQASMQLTALEFHARKNGSKTEWSASKALVNRAANEQGISTDNINDTYMELSKKFVGLRGEVAVPAGVTRQAKQIIANKSYTDQEAILKIYQRLLRGRTSRTSSSELMRRAVAEHVRNKRRNDSATRTDFTNPQDRTGKPCGQSFIPKSQKCSKKSTTAAYANKPQPEAKKGGGDNTLAKVVGGTALAAGAAVVGGGAAAFKYRRRLRVYGGNSETIAKGMNLAIVRMNQKDVTERISKLPKPFQKGATQLLGKAKAAAAYIAADVQGFDLKSVNNKNNFTTWATEDKSQVMSIGSVDDTLVVFNAKQAGKVALRTENGNSVPIYDMDFTTDLGFQQKKGVSREAGMTTVKMVKAMNEATLPELSRNALLKNVPYGSDSKGARRASLYKRAGYRELRGQRGNAQWAMLNNGKFEKIPEDYDKFFDALIKGKSYDEARRGDALSFERFDFTAASERKGKPCGKSFIGKTETCTKGRGTYAQRSQSKTAESKPSNPTPYIAAAALLASTTSIIVNRKAIARNLRKIKTAVRQFKGEDTITTPENVIAVENFAKRAKATTGFDPQHPSNRVWTKDLNDPQARRFSVMNQKMHDMGLLPAQRKYKFNQAFDVGTKQISDAIRRAKSPEAVKFADAVERLEISSYGDFSTNMKALANRSGMTASERGAMDNFYAQLESDDAFNFGGLAMDGKNPAVKQGLTGADKDRLYRVFRGHERPGRALNYSPDQLNAAIQISRNASKKRTSGDDLDIAEAVAGGVATGPARGANADVGTLVHESMHVMDFNGGNLRRREQLIERNQQAMLAEAEKYGFSQYSGLDPGVYNEFTAEAAVYYVFDSANFKKTAPTIYGMVDAIVTKAARV